MASVQGVARSPLNTRQHMWRLMLERADGFTITDIVGGCNTASRESVRTYLRALAAAGYIEPLPDVVRNGRRQRRWRVVRRQARAPRVRRDGAAAKEWRGQQQMWNAMRRLDHFDWHELAHIASTETCVISPATARRYLGLLRHAGYLAEVASARPGRRGRWRLKCDTGPRAPRVVRALHDPNTNEIILGAERLGTRTRQGDGK